MIRTHKFSELEQRDELLQTMRHILDLADEQAKGIDGYEQIAEWARSAIAKTVTNS